jgi:hypothetical protein
MDLSQKYLKWDGIEAQMVEYLLSKCEALNSNPKLQYDQKRKRKEKDTGSMA